MEGNCAYHPTKPAHWICPDCDTMYCNGCISTRERGGYTRNKETVRFCPKCNVAAEWVGASNLIPPFWNRLHKFFTYPLSPIPLGLSLGLALLAALFASPGLITGLIRLMLWAVLIKYSFAALKYTAQGDLRPPPVTSKTITEDIGEVFKQLGIYIALIIGFIVIAGLGSPFLAIVYLLLAFLSVPAMIIVFVTTGSLIQALNPLVFGRLALRIGWGYLLMYFFLALLGAAPAAAWNYIISHLPPALHVFLFSFAKNYYTIITYHLMGYVLLQYHVEVGYSVDYENFFDPTQEKEEEAPAASPEEARELSILQEANRMIQDGQVDQALKYIVEKTRGKITNLDLSERLYKLLQFKKMQPQMIKYARNHLQLLVQNNQKNSACELYEDCSRLDPKFLPRSSSMFQIARWQNESGMVQEALQTLQRMIKFYPQDPLTPKAYLQAAKIYNDRLTDPEKAKKILTGTLKKYPAHDAVPEIKAYLNFLSA